MKPKREITLGEMQDECNANTDGKGSRCCSRCSMEKVCGGSIDGTPPSTWDLTDAPRFTDAQMALLRGLYEGGVRKIVRGMFVDYMEDKGGKKIVLDFLGIEPNSKFDLAELFGKEGE